MMKLVQRIREHQKLNNSIFAMLECILPETIRVEPQHLTAPNESQTEALPPPPLLTENFTTVDTFNASEQ